ncbi:hypothetical protein ACJX0J_029494, partial [Zea mays]
TEILLPLLHTDRTSSGLRTLLLFYGQKKARRIVARMKNPVACIFTGHRAVKPTDLLSTGRKLIVRRDAANARRACLSMPHLSGLAGRIRGNQSMVYKNKYEQNKQPETTKGKEEQLIS